MAKKKDKEKEKEKAGAQTARDEIVESAHRIWLAGLGAVAAAEEEGSKFFRRLVERGEAVENRSKERFDDVKEKAEERWSKIGDTFDDRISSTLRRLGVPSRDEIHELTKRVEELTSKVEGLRQPPSGRS